MAGRSHPGTQVRWRAKPVPSGERPVGASWVEGFGGLASLAMYLSATRSAWLRAAAARPISRDGSVGGNAVCRGISALVLIAI
jgi:hypothetical protein